MCQTNSQDFSFFFFNFCFGGNEFELEKKESFLCFVYKIFMNNLQHQHNKRKVYDKQQQQQNST